MDLYTDNNPKTTTKGLGFKNAQVAKDTLKKIAHRDPIYQKQVVITMYHRAKYHPHRNENMEKAMKIYAKWMDIRKIKYNREKTGGSNVKRGKNVPKNIDKSRVKNCCQSNRSDNYCYNQWSNKIYNIEKRRFTRDKCLKGPVKGFSMIASCAPYNKCVQKAGGQKNINGNSLEMCSSNPMTGFYRDGFCNTGSEDVGTHSICATVTDQFLQFSKRRGNNLTDKNQYFPGLKNGDKWCLCALRWKEAYDHGLAPPIISEATNITTTNYISKHILDKFAH